MLSFTDAQIKELTQDVYDYPVTSAQLAANLAAISAQQSGLLIKDGGHAVYTTQLLNRMQQYHLEYQYITGITHTDYNPAAIQDAAQLLPSNIHFPANYIYFAPKVDNSNIGLPTGAWANTEDAAITTAQAWLALLKTGWNDGIANETTTTGFIGGDLVTVTDTTNFAVGNRVLFRSGSNYLYGTVTQILFGNLLRISITLSNGGYAGILTGAVVTNFFGGFNLAQRDSGVGANAAESNFMAALKIQVDNAVQAWETRILVVQGALTANDSPGTDATQIAAQLVIVNGHISTINTWQAFPAIGVGTSRFGTNLPAIETAFTNRIAQEITRAAQIITALGTINQVGENATGPGRYFDLFENLNLRLNKIQGTLRQYYDVVLAISAINAQISTVDDIYARDSATFNVKKMTTTAGSGTNTVSLDSVAGLAISDPIKFMSSDQAVLTGTITGISGLDVTLSFTVSAAYLKSKSARLVKQN